MKKGTPYVWAYQQHTIVAGTYYSDLLQGTMNYKHFLFFVDVLMGVNAGATCDVTIQVRLPGKPVIWCDYKDFTQVLQNTHINQNQVYNQLLGVFRFRIVYNQNSVVGDKTLISGYMSE